MTITTSRRGFLQSSAVGASAAAGVAVVGIDAAIERFLLRVENLHRDAGVGIRHRNAAAHGACADDRGAQLSCRVHGATGAKLAKSQRGATENP